MSGHGIRERTQRADAVLWRDRVVAETYVSRADLAPSISAHGLFRVLRFLAARGHVERASGDLIRPIGARAGELF